MAEQNGLVIRKSDRQLGRRACKFNFFLLDKTVDLTTGMHCTVEKYRISIEGLEDDIHCWASRHSLGFEDDDLGSSPGWWAATVATYCPSRPGELPKFLSSKPCK